MINVAKIKTVKQDGIPKYEKWSTNIIKFLGSDFSAIMLSIFLTILQSFHPSKVLISFQVFEDVISNNIFSYLLTLFIELFVLYYVIRKEIFISKLFMVFSMAINIYYYVNKFNIFTANGFEFDIRIIPAIAFSIVIPFAIYKVSEQIKNIAQQ